MTAAAAPVAAAPADDKALSTLRALAARGGIELHRPDGGTLLLCRWGRAAP